VNAPLIEKMAPPRWLPPLGRAVLVGTLLFAGWLRFDRGSWIGGVGALAWLALIGAFAVRALLRRIKPEISASIETPGGYEAMRVSIIAKKRRDWTAMQQRGPILLVRQYTLFLALVAYVLAIILLPAALAQPFPNIAVPAFLKISAIAIVASFGPGMVWAVREWKKRERKWAEYDARTS